MSCFLDSHKEKYNFTLGNSLFSVVTGLSGAVYSKRHFEISQNQGMSVWGHRTIAVLEALPVLGGLTALLERIAFFVEETFSGYKDFQKMVKNAEKSITEHTKKSPEQPYASVSDIRKRVPFCPLSLQWVAHGKQGNRSKFVREIDSGLITGVFNGHDGPGVAKRANDLFQEKFQGKLVRHNYNIRKTFTEVINEIHEEIIADKDLDQMRSTAVICFIDKKTNLIYTATLGDCEANIYRKIDGQVKSIPLSCVRNWHSEKDIERLYNAVVEFGNGCERWWRSVFNKETFFESVRAKRPKGVRYPSFQGCINTSRAIGKAPAAVSHKPKVTVNQLQEEDTLVLVCDGLKDFVTEREIIEELTTYCGPGDSAAKQLVDYAVMEKRPDGLKGSVAEIEMQVWCEPHNHYCIAKEKPLKKRSKDNVTVVAINVKKSQAAFEVRPGGGE